MRNAPNWRRILLLLVASSLLLFIAFGATKLLSLEHAIATGLVTDTSSGEPVANAKVVVTTWRRYLASVGSPKSYGTTTDSQGRFHVDVIPGYRISHIDVAASAPDNGYAFQGNIGTEFVQLATKKQSECGRARSLLLPV